MLAKDGLALFEDRVIRDARPPIDEATIAKIAARCSGPIPDGLLALWRTTFGGTLDYGLSVDFGGVIAGISFTELFYPGSSGYRDLWGWIDHEAELAEESASEDGKPWSGKLDFLPFGGFEYCSRMYVRVKAGPDHGEVHAWEEGLPPAWRLRLHRDSVACVARDVPSLFRELAFDEDPRTASEHAAGRELIRAIEAVPDAAIRDELLRSVGRAVLDWRSAIDARSIASRPRLVRLALEHAARGDDPPLLERLESVGCDLGQRLSGGGTALDHALIANAPRATRLLLDRGLPVKDAIRNGAAHASLELVAELLSRGAEPDRIAALTAISNDHLDSALVIASALVAREPSTAEKLAGEALRRADEAEKDALRVESRELISSHPADVYRSRAAGYRKLALHVKAPRS